MDPLSSLPIWFSLDLWHTRRDSGEIATTDLRSESFIPLLCKRQLEVLCFSYPHNKIDLNRLPKPIFFFTKKRTTFSKSFGTLQKRDEPPFFFIYAESPQPGSFQVSLLCHLDSNRTESTSPDPPFLLFDASFVLCRKWAFLFSFLYLEVR